MLATSDLGLSLSSLPTMLQIVVFKATGISPNACYAHEFSMASQTWSPQCSWSCVSFDHNLAIHYPLRYSFIPTSARVAKAGLVFLTKSKLLVLLLHFTLNRLDYCRKNLLSHPSCPHQNVRKLTCSDNTVNFFSDFFVALCMMLGSVFIAVSYVLILKTVMGIGSQKERPTAFSTCVSHVCAVLIFCVPTIALASLHHFGKHTAPMAVIIIADIYLLVPPQILSKDTANL